MGWTHQMRIFRIFLVPAHQIPVYWSAAFTVSASQMSQLLSFLTSVNKFLSKLRTMNYFFYIHIQHIVLRTENRANFIYFSLVLTWYEPIHIAGSVCLSTLLSVCLICSVWTVLLSWYLQMTDDTTSNNVKYISVDLWLSLDTLCSHYEVEW